MLFHVLVFRRWQLHERQLPCLQVCRHGGYLSQNGQRYHAVQSAIGAVMAADPAMRDPHAAADQVDLTQFAWPMLDHVVKEEEQEFPGAMPKHAGAVPPDPLDHLPGPEMIMAKGKGKGKGKAPPVPKGKAAPQHKARPAAKPAA